MPSSSMRAEVTNALLWLSKLSTIFCLQRVDLRRVRLLTLAPRARLHHVRHGERGLLGAHHGGLRVRPREQEARIVGAPAHAVVAGAERGAAHQRDLRHVRVRHRLDHLRAVLDHAGFLGRLADDVAGGVLQIEDRQPGLAARLDEVRRFRCAGRIERPVVGDDADRKTLHGGVAAYGRGAVVRLEVEEIAIVGEARDHLAHVDRRLAVRRHDAEQFVRVVARRLALRRGHIAPVQARDHLAREAHAVRVVLGEIFAEPRHMRVHHGAAELLVGRDLAGRGLQQRRPGEERLGAAAHHDDVVGEARHVGAARGR